MIKSVFRYIISREVYSQYTENRSSLLQVLSLENFIKIGYATIFVIVAIGISVNFSNRNNVRVSDIRPGDSLYLSPWREYTYNEIPIYNLNLDSSHLHFKYTHKIDTNKLGDYFLGLASGEGVDEFIELDRSKTVSISKPIDEDILYEYYDYNENEFLSIDDISLAETKKPETGAFYLFISLLVTYFSLLRFLGSIFRFFKSKIPLYDREPIYKSDNRFKTGKRIVRWKSVIKDYRPMTEDEKSTHKTQQLTRIIVSGILLAASVYYFAYRWGFENLISSIG